MKKIILGTSAIIVTLVSAFAFTNHNKKFGTATVYTRSGTPLAYRLTSSPKCVTIDQGLGTCPSTLVYYTKTGAIFTLYPNTVFITN
jgi:hypothetical protein